MGVEFSPLHPDGLSLAIFPTPPRDLSKVRDGLAGLRAELEDLLTNPLHIKGKALDTTIEVKRQAIAAWETMERELLAPKRGPAKKGAAK